jgi:hypothetical protein
MSPRQVTFVARKHNAVHDSSFLSYAVPFYVQGRQCCAGVLCHRMPGLSEEVSAALPKRLGVIAEIGMMSYV